MFRPSTPISLLNLIKFGVEYQTHVCAGTGQIYKFQNNKKLLPFWRHKNALSLSIPMKEREEKWKERGNKLSDVKGPMQCPLVLLVKAG
jgi:hypothetical protein